MGRFGGSRARRAATRRRRPSEGTECGSERRNVRLIGESRGVSPSQPTGRVPPTLAIVFLGYLGAIQVAAPNIASTALVSASRGLSMDSGQVVMAASVQTLAIAATVISTGLLSDRFGRRHVLMASLVLGVIGSLTVAAAPTPIVYLVGQALTGIALGGIYGAAYAYIRVIAKPGRLAGAVGLFSAVNMLTTLAVTFLGGTVSSIDWRLTFLIIPLMSGIALLLTPVILPLQGKMKHPPTDYPGQLLLIGGVASGLLGISKIGTSPTAAFTLVPLAIGLLLMLGFLIRESRVEGHFFPVSIFKNPVFLAAILAGLAYNFGTAVAFLQVTNLWQYINGLETSEVAVWQIPLIATGILTALLFGQLMNRGLTNRATLLIGSSASAAGFVVLSLTHSSQGLLGFLPGLILTGGGLVICAIPFGNLILKEAPVGYYGVVTSSRNSIGQIFYSIGLAIPTVLIDKMTVGGTVQRLTDAGVPPQQVGTGLDAVTAYAAKSTTPKTSLGKEALSDAVVSYGNSFETMMLITAAICLLAGIAGFLILRSHAARAEAVPPTVRYPD